MTRIIAPFGLIFLAACETGIVSVDDGSLLSEQPAVDNDGDGYNADNDCDDNDATVYPGAVDVCDGIDNDCDPTVAYSQDGEVIPTRLGEPDLCDDNDDDSWSLGEDCDDADPSVYPGATEVDNGIDDDCDGEIDEGFEDEPVDADGDGYSADDDCDDTNAFVHPGAMEICGNDVDENCDGIAEDQDGDGNLTSGSHPDCDDNDAAVYYGAPEVDNGIDDDCDGSIDEGFDTPPTDADGDGYDVDEDCDDSDASVNPGATEVCGDGLDNDCSGSDASCGSPDADGDGYNSFSDCDDTDASVNPAASEYNAGIDGTDNDCDGSVDEDWQAYVRATYPVSGSYTLNTALYSSGSSPSARSWSDESVSVSDNEAQVEYLTSEYGDVSGFCGLIINGDGYGLDYLCYGGSRDTSVAFDMYFDGVWYDEYDLEVWIADQSNSSCALILQVDPSSSCDPVDDT